MRKYEVSITVIVEAISSFEAINEFESMVSKRIYNLKKYKVTELKQPPKVDPLIDENTINEHEI